MAALDDAVMLSKLIRRTFVTCDDTGISEEVLMREGGDCLFSDDSSTDSPSSSPVHRQYSHSPDITIRKEKKVKASVKVGLREKEREPGADEKGTIKGIIEKVENVIDKNEQEKKEITNLNQEKIEKSSENLEKILNELGNAQEKGKGRRCGGEGLRAMIEDHDRLVRSSVWGQYSRLEASVNCGVKTVTIHATMATDTTKTFVVSMTSVSDVSVEEFIGLVCWRYYIQQVQPPLRENHPSKYHLLMVDSSGHVDWDLPPLDHHQPILKFAFKHLALVEATNIESPAKNMKDLKSLKNFAF